MPDYVSLAATAHRLISASGREILLAKASEVLPDPDKPWIPADPAGEVTVPLMGVFVPPGSIRQFGLTALGEGTEYTELTQFSEQVVIVAQGELDLREYTTVIDREDRWGILAVQVLRPADVNVLGFIGVRR